MTGIGLTLGELEEYCDFTTPYTCYILQVISRKKENPLQTEKDKLVRQTRRTVSTLDELRESYRDLAKIAQDLSNDTGVSYRMYISVNRRDILKASRVMLGWLLDRMLDKGDHTQALVKLGSEWKSILSRDNCRYDKNWLLDVDDPGVVGTLQDALLDNLIEVVHVARTPNGYHIVVRPFNPKLLLLGPSVSICKDHLLLVGVYQKESE